ncbi:MAG: hypothetical protein JWM16_546 [Verrucomicrobiales bacterium]|nr:hypothetical protein [Verrucomicrobiales bacterium]
MRTRFQKVIAGLGLALSTVLLLWFLSPSGETLTVRLKDGTKLRLAHMSYGKEHRYAPGPAWQRLLTKAPTRISRIFGVNSRPAWYPEDTLVVWLERDDPSGRQLFPQSLRVLDANGLASPYIYIDRQVSLSNHTTWSSFLLTSFPRRQPFLDFEWISCSPTNLMVREEAAFFRVKNPWLTPKAASILPPWPASAEFDGEQFTLLGINTGLEATGTLAYRSLSNQWTEFRFRIGTNEPAQLTTNRLVEGKWALKSLELRDAFGNFIREREPLGRIFPMGDHDMSRSDDGIGLIPGAAWPDQRWNVRAEFQTSFAVSDPLHTWTTTIPVPAPGETLPLRQTGQIEVFTIKLQSIGRDPAKAGLVPPTIFRMDSHENAQVLPKPLIAGSYTALLVHAEDLRGTNVLYHYRGGDDKASTRYELQVAPESKELKITFAVQHSIIVELSGQPTIFRTNVIHWER